MAFASEMEELVRRGSDWLAVGSREANTQESPLPDRPQIILKNLMPRLGMCGPSDCRVAFISRGQLQGATGVASDANAAAVRRWHCRHWQPTDSRWREQPTHSMADLHALYCGLAQEGAWTQSGLDRTSLSVVST
jgi:hypothetical protein